MARISTEAVVRSKGKRVGHRPRTFAAMVPCDDDTLTDRLHLRIGGDEQHGPPGFEHKPNRHVVKAAQRIGFVVDASDDKVGNAGLMDDVAKDFCVVQRLMPPVMRRIAGRRRLLEALLYGFGRLALTMIMLSENVRRHAAHKG